MNLGTTDTSRDALRQIEPELPTWREQVYDIIAKADGITCREVGGI